jgi:outer membrane autotransporter protein
MNRAGAESMRYAISQMPDSAASSFKIGREINQRIVARGSEYRAANGFASTQSPACSSKQGACGPDQGNTLSGWIRGYGSVGEADQNGYFDAYDASTWGTVIGIDKSFGNILIGLAGGYGFSSIEGAYKAETDMTHGTIYSTFGGDAVFVDMGLTYGQGSTKESGIHNGKFDSDMLSFYIGGGKVYNLKNRLLITPEASMLASFYQQDGFERSGVWGTAKADSFDSNSYLLSLGVNLTPASESTLFNTAIGYQPEVRLHWLHELEADNGDFMYSVNGSGFQPLSVRPRDENTVRVGFGLDMWSWKYEKAKLELDYDGLFSDTYTEHIVSGKASYEF